MTTNAVMTRFTIRVLLEGLGHATGDAPLIGLERGNLRKPRAARRRAPAPAAGTIRRVA